MPKPGSARSGGEPESRNARLTSVLRAVTRRYGLSLGDRACLALAMREQSRVLTADRAWLKLHLGVDIAVIR